MKKAKEDLEGRGGGTGSSLLDQLYFGEGPRKGNELWQRGGHRGIGNWEMSQVGDGFSALIAEPGPVDYAPVTAGAAADDQADGKQCEHLVWSWGGHMCGLGALCS